MALFLATTSGKGGVGKSSVSAGLGFAFSALKQKVLLVDMDEGLRCLDLFLGLDDKTVLDLGDALTANDINDIAYSAKPEGLFLIPAPERVGEINPEDLKRFAKKADSLFDVVIFDFPAGLNFTLYSALPRDTVFLGVATPDPVSVRDVAMASEKLHELGLNSRLIINRFDLKEHKKRHLSSIDGIINDSSLQLLGIIPEGKDINLLSIKHKLKKNGRPIKAFLRIAGRLQYKNIPLMKLKKI